jgi:antitoxin PrlF
MSRAKITSKGQVTIPRDIRMKLGLKVGERVDFEEKDGVVFLRKVMKANPFEKWEGFLTNHESESPDTIVEELRGL